MRAAQRKVGVLARARVIRFTERDVIASIELRHLALISFWDAMIVHAARIAGAEAGGSGAIGAGAG
jgi:predicted nucleic acid-binding protein